MRKYTKEEFSAACVAEIQPGESVVVICNNERDVQNVRLIAAQYKRINEPKAITRYASSKVQTDDGKIELTLKALTV